MPQDTREKLTADQIYDRLINVQRIKSATGQIKFNLCNLELTVKTTDIVGGAIENWVREWMIVNNISFDPNRITQSKPDVFLDVDDHKKGLLEIKAFNRQAGPGFDIADFRGFAFELISKPYLLDIDCLIFAYDMNTDTGDIVVKDAWLKKIWAIASSSDAWPLKVQGSKDKSTIKKVRPANWYSERARFKPFESKLDFLSAYEQTLYDYQATRASASNWKFQLKHSYRNYYGEDLIIPRWDDIKSRYV